MVVEEFGPYRLEALLGRGGMGEVFRAYDNDHDRLVALKRLAAHLADDPEFQGRFRREARLAAKLRNPHIVPIHRFGELDGHLFIDMRFIDGYDVAELIDAVGPLEPQRAVSIIEQVGSALGTAHAAGLVHRDVKPSNLLVDQENSQDDHDFVYLVDFGISRPTAAAPTHSLTRTGALLGTIAYMAPEQFDGMADSRSDIYALTCVFFELLTGAKPYRSGGLPALMNAHINVPPPLPSNLRPELSTSFDDVIRRGMEKQPDDRYSSTAEFVRAARSALTNGGDAATDQASTYVVERADRRSKEADRIRNHRENARRAPADARHALPDDLPQSDDSLSSPEGDVPTMSRTDAGIAVEPTVPGGLTPSATTVSDGTGPSLANRTTHFRTRELDDQPPSSDGGRKRAGAVVASVLPSPSSARWC